MAYADYEQLMTMTEASPRVAFRGWGMDASLQHVHSPGSEERFIHAHLVAHFQRFCSHTCRHGGRLPAGAHQLHGARAHRELCASWTDQFDLLQITGHQLTG